MYPETFFSNEQNDILNLLKHNPKHQAANQPKGAVIAPQFANKINTEKSLMCQYVHSHALKIDYRNKIFSIIAYYCFLDKSAQSLTSFIKEIVTIHQQMVVFLSVDEHTMNHCSLLQNPVPKQWPTERKRFLNIKQHSGLGQLA